ncbi:hypothetical protein O181_009732 [Austropuccinia psidii MF-1]|uniref:DNA primase n=1 Tax=Austropuccinia psidii MF-1 TaxID=1389203 RepID=A0A9Q3BR99_9BASI|nr:hypothetical protein [Austropuccinia psidii MF-1]
MGLWPFSQRKFCVLTLAGAPLGARPYIGAPNWSISGRPQGASFRLKPVSISNSQPFRTPTFLSSSTRDLVETLGYFKMSQVLDNLPLEQLFDTEMEADDAPLDRETYQMLMQYDDPWADLKDPHVMMNFYRRIFPWKQLFLWLNQAEVPNYAFTHREFAVTLQNEAYLRYNSYADHIELQKDIIRLNPLRFEVGCTYSVQPKDRKTVPKAAFKPILRELVFDIDLTDYDGIRRCCSDKQICKKCWKFMAMAIEVLDLSLREDFGFKHLLWIFSGRRGVHCWVSDEKALKLTDELRRALVNYLDIIKGGAKNGLKVDLKSPLHPAVKRNLNILKKSFREVVLEDQDVFQNHENFLQMWGDMELQTKFSAKWFSNPGLSSAEKWQEVFDYIDQHKADKKKYFQARDTINNIVLHYSYPRIDLEVSKHMNHLLKSPFCVHPATGKLCVPIDPTRAFAFDPTTVPDVRDLLRELDKDSKTNPSGATEEDNASTKLPGWYYTSLRPYVEMFQKHINELIKARSKTTQTTQLHWYKY